MLLICNDCGTEKRLYGNVNIIKSFYLCAKCGSRDFEIIKEIEEYVERELNEIEKLIFRMRLMMGEKPKIISKLLNIPVKVVYKVTFIVRRKIKAHLLQKFGEEILDLID